METKQCIRCGYYCNITSFKPNKKNKKWRGKICRWCRNEQRKERWHTVEKHDQEVMNKNRERVKLWHGEHKEQNAESARTWRNSTDKGYWSNKITGIKANCRTRGLDCEINRTTTGINIYERSTRRGRRKKAIHSSKSN